MTSSALLAGLAGFIIGIGVASTIRQSPDTNSSSHPLVGAGFLIMFAAIIFAAFFWALMRAARLIAAAEQRATDIVDGLPV